MIFELLCLYFLIFDVMRYIIAECVEVIRVLLFSIINVARVFNRLLLLSMVCVSID